MKNAVKQFELPYLAQGLSLTFQTMVTQLTWSVEYMTVLQHIPGGIIKLEYHCLG